MDNKEIAGWDKFGRSFSFTFDQIMKLKEILSLEEAARLSNLISSLKDFGELNILYDIQKAQKENGGGFYDIVPDLLPLLPDIRLSNNDSLFEVIIWLAEKRKDHLLRLETTGYPLKFRGNKFDKETLDTPKRIKINLDTSLIGKILDYFCTNTPSENDAIKISKNMIFDEVIKHRNGLGYVPGPVFKNEFIEYFLKQSVNKAPINEIWKWLSPWNFFDFSDIYQNRLKYREMLSTLKTHSKTICDLVGSRLERFTPVDFSFEEPFVLSVEWAIRGWATNKFAGLNIEWIKDDYDKLIDIITHETFHRIQAAIYPGSDGKTKDFSVIEHHFSDSRYDSFHEAITYVFLEGTATYVEKGAISSDESEKILKSIELLEKIHMTIFSGSEESVEDLINEGLRSNGPFYTLGRYISEIIEETYGTGTIGECLRKGSPVFFKRYINTNNSEYKFSPAFVKCIMELSELFALEVGN